MTIKGHFLGYKAEDYVSKKTGKAGIARELTILTENKELLVFGYDSFGQETDYDSIERLKEGDAISLSVQVRPNKYNRNYPRVVILGA